MSSWLQTRTGGETLNPESPKNSKMAAVAAIAMVGMTLYWTFTYSGPYRYLAELQVKWLGYYVPKLTAMVIILGFLAIAGLIKVVLRGAERPVPGLANAPVAAAPVKNVGVPQPWLQYARYAAPLIVVVSADGCISTEHKQAACSNWRLWILNQESCIPGSCMPRCEDI
jgi:hypothetical protein